MALSYRINIDSDYMTTLFNHIMAYNPIQTESEPFYFKTPDANHFKFFNITNDGILMQEDPNRDRMEFWNDIFNELKHLWNTTFDFSLWENFQRHRSFHFSPK